MELTEKAKQAESIWLHYQKALISNDFKNQTHLQLIRDNEKIWRTRYLHETEEISHIIMQQAGFNIIENSNGQFYI